MKKINLLYLLPILVFYNNCGEFHSLETVTGESYADPTSSPQVINGKALYETNCQSCHGTTPDQRAFGADSDKIKAALLVVSNMRTPQLNQLKQDQIDDIASYLLALAGQTPTNPHGGSPNPPLPPNQPYNPPSSQPLLRAEAFGESGAQRLTKDQLVRTVEQNLKTKIQNFTKYIPRDSSSGTYFANDYTSLSVTSSMVEDYSTFAEKAAKAYTEQKLIQDIGCRPAGPQDFDCFRSFLTKMGRRFFRRPMSSNEVARFEQSLMDYAQADSNFMSAVELALEAFLQHPEFLYRLEINGSSAGALTKLTQYEVATRLAFFLTGKGPSDTLLNLAAQNQLMTANQREEVARDLLESQDSLENFQEFHGSWLGYGEIHSNHNLAAHFELETNKLIEQVNFVEKADWLSIFNSSKTYVTPELAQHYGMNSVSQAKWVSTQGDKQSGLLSHASFAMVGRKFNDTSPTLRGYEVYKRLYCGSFDIPLPANVDVTEAPGNPNDCKTERYAMRGISSCAGCHSITDGIGFGMEKIDPFGKVRNFEPQNNQCEISGEGELFGTDFTGPKELAAHISGDPKVGACATQNLFEFMMGRPVTDSDEATLLALEGEYYETRSMHGIILAIVRSEGMIHKGGQ